MSQRLACGDCFCNPCQCAANEAVRDRDEAKLAIWDDLQKSLAIALCHWRPTKATNHDYLKCVAVMVKCRAVLDATPTAGS